MYSTREMTVNSVATRSKVVPRLAAGSRKRVSHPSVAWLLPSSSVNAPICVTLTIPRQTLGNLTTLVGDMAMGTWAWLLNKQKGWAFGGQAGDCITHNSKGAERTERR